jgi:hypothetical protein
MITYDYYDIEVPGDCADTVEELADIAINEAMERARLYCMPALWSARLVDGVVGDWAVMFRVSRKRYKRAARLPSDRQHTPGRPPGPIRLPATI